MHFLGFSTSITEKLAYRNIKFINRNAAINAKTEKTGVIIILFKREDDEKKKKEIPAPMRIDITSDERTKKPANSPKSEAAQCP